MDTVYGVWMKKDELDLYSLMTLGGNGRSNIFTGAKNVGKPVIISYIEFILYYIFLKKVKNSKEP